MPIRINLIRVIVRNLFILLLLFTMGGAQAAPHGDELFGRHCSVCHGADGEGGVGVPLSLPSFINSVSDDYLVKTIRVGRPGRIMPAFAELSDAQVNAIASFMRSWANKPAPNYDTATIAGDAKHGKELFAGYCAQCHGENATGGKGTGVTFSRKRDLPITAPALNNAGFLASATDAMIKDTLMLGREGTPMTSALVTGLSEKDVNDLVAYIRAFENGYKQQADKQAEDAVIVVESPYTLEETIENVKMAITDQNFTLIRTDYLDHGLVEEGKENKKQVVLHFCNFGFLFDALTLDPRVGMFLPCRVTVVEHEGKVSVMTINPLRLSMLFNNDELDEACKHMHEVYVAILEDAIL
jgi:cytochrome c oxidase cbb3-type subunit 3